jgi:hypothetical protein
LKKSERAAKVRQKNSGIANFSTAVVQIVCNADLPPAERVTLSVFEDFVIEMGSVCEPRARLESTERVGEE